MIISFDIDNTLIPYSDEFQVEEKTFLAKLLRTEPIRKGTVHLFKELERRGHNIWIYTTSYRSKFKLKTIFRTYGFKPLRIINETINQEILKKHRCAASKNPKLYGIDIHVDDSKGVGLEGDKFGFETIIISTEDKNWTKTILKRIEEIE